MAGTWRASSHTLIRCDLYSAKRWNAAKKKSLIKGMDCVIHVTSSKLSVRLGNSSKMISHGISCAKCEGCVLHHAAINRFWHQSQ